MLRFLRLALGAALLAAVGLVGLTGVAAAAHRTVVEVSGNPSCAGGLKIEPVVDGTYGPITIDVTGSSFSFTTDGTLVTTVIVKGGPNANLYTYPAPGLSSDAGLNAPINPNNGKPYGLSHLCFFVDDKKDPEPTK